MEHEEEAVHDIVTILNTVLQVEYSNVVNWPRWVSRIKDQVAVEKLRRMATDSMRHFDFTDRLIRQLGGSPHFGFELEEDESDLKATLHKQLDKEKLARMGYQEAAELTENEDLREQLKAQTRAEEFHMQLLQEVLSQLRDEDFS